MKKAGWPGFILVLLTALLWALPCSVGFAEGVYLDTSVFNEEKFSNKVEDCDKESFRAYVDDHYPDKENVKEEAPVWGSITVSSVGRALYERQWLKTATGEDACIVSWVSDNTIGSGENKRRSYEIYGLVSLKYPDTGKEKILKISVRNMKSSVQPDVAGYRKMLSDYIGALSIRFINPAAAEPVKPVEEPPAEPEKAAPPEGKPQDLGILVFAKEEPGEDAGHVFPLSIIKGGYISDKDAADMISFGDIPEGMGCFRLYLRKNFGNELQIGGRAQSLYVRITEVTAEGEEVARDDLAAKLQISSPHPEVKIWDGGMTEGYRGVEVSIPEGNAEEFQQEGCQIVFSIQGQGGTFKEHVVFRVVGDAAIVFGQENLSLPARYDKVTRLPFGVVNFGEAEVTAEADGGYQVTLEADGEHPGVYYANITETDKSEKAPGEIDIGHLNVKAVKRDPVTGEEQALTKELPIYRIHMGLIVDVDGIDCCGLLKQEALQTKSLLNIKKEDFECGTTKANIKILTWDEETNSVFTIAPVPVEGSFHVAPKNAGDESLQKIIDELQLDIVPVEVTKEGTRCLIFGKAVLDPPSRYGAVLDFDARWTRKDGSEEVVHCKKDVLLRSQKPLNIKDADKEKYLADTRKTSELLDHIITVIEARDLWEQLFPLYNLAKLMRDGYDPDYGYDAYQVAKVKYVWTKYNQGGFLGANADPPVEAPTLADEAWMFTRATLEMGEVAENRLGFAGRMVLGHFTAGLSEVALNSLKVGRDMLAYAENDAIEDSKKSAWGMFCAGAKPVVVDFLMQNAIETGMGKLGVKPDTVSATETMKQNFISAGKFLDPRTMGTRLKGAVERGRSALASAKETGQRLWAKAKGQSRTAAEDLAETVHKKAAAEGEELVRKLEQMAESNKDVVQKIKQRASGQLGDLPAGAGEYLELGALNDQLARKMELQNLVLEVQSNKSAMRYLKSYQGANAQATRAAFNNTMLDLYQDVGEAWKTELSAALNVPRNRIGIVNMSGTGIGKLRSGLTTTFDKDWTAELLLEGGFTKNVDLNTSTKTFRETFYRRVKGGANPPSEEAASKLCRLYDQTVVSDGHPEMYGSVKDDVFRAIDPARQAEKFADADGVAKAIAYKGKDRFAEAATATEKALKLQDEAMKLAASDPAKSTLMMQESIQLMKESAREGQEGLRQLTKQFDNILVPRDLIAQGNGKLSAISQKLYDMHEIARSCSVDGIMSYETVKRIFRDEFGMTMEDFANATGELAKLIDL